MGACVEGFEPGGRVTGAVRVPGSKSIAQRALLAALVARGRTVLDGLPDGEDVRACLGAAAELGAGLTAVRGGLALSGVGGRRLQGADVGIGESGTAARIVTALVALHGLHGSSRVVRARGSLVGRSSPALFRALREAGAELDELGPGGWPVRVTCGSDPQRPLLLHEPSSSQEVSALLICAGAAGGGQVLVEGAIPSAPYVRMTLDVMDRFGSASSVTQLDTEQRRFEVESELRAPDEPFTIEPDASAAAVALAAGCLSGGTAQVKRLNENSIQGDARIVAHLAAFGCRAGHADGGAWASGAPEHGADLDLSHEPDLAPVLAAVAGAVALADRGASRLDGLGTLPGKESSRIEVLAGGLRALGLDVSFGETFLAVAPGKPSAAALTLDSRGDHRMAFAFALLSLVRPGLRVSRPGAVAKSWPGFWEDLAEAGARRA